MLTITYTVLALPAQTPQDITGWKFWFTGKTSAGQPDNAALFQKTSPSSGVAIGSPATDGTITVTIDPADTEGLTANTTILFDLQTRDANGRIDTLDEDSISVTIDITQTRT